MIRFIAAVEIDYWFGMWRAIRVVILPVVWPADVSDKVH